MKIINIIKQTIDKYDLIRKNDSVLIALSGGPDSVFLLNLFETIRKEYQISISAVHVNHNIRKKESLKEERFCRKICEDLGVELFVISEDIPALVKKSKTGIEETARNFRLGIYTKLSNEFGFSKVATGHHRDDRAETVLFRILRGTGRTGLKGITAKRDNLIRPLFDTTKEDILSYLKKNKLPFCVDSSNLKSKYSRNYLRNELLPLIRKNINANIDNTLINLSETSTEEEEFLNNLVEKHLKRVIFETAGGKIKIHQKKFLKLDLWLRRRILRHCITTLSSNKVAPDREVIERLEILVKKPKDQISLPGGIQAVSLDKYLVIYKRHGRTLLKKLIVGEKIELNWPSFKVKSSIKNSNKIKKFKKRKALTGYFDYKKLQPPFEIRLFSEGDRFQPLGMKGNKKVGNYLTDVKFPVVFRDEVLVVNDKRGIFWVVGHEIDERAKIDSSSQEVLKIEFYR